jgi:hypothetical protein
MHAIPFDICLRCNKVRTVLAFSIKPVVPRCACTDGDVMCTPDGVFQQAVFDAYAVLAVECVEEDLLHMLLRMQHFASSAGAALLEGDTKLFVSCLVSNIAISWLLMARTCIFDEVNRYDEADEVDEADEADEASEFDEADKSSEFDEADELSAIDEVDAPSEVSESDDVNVAEYMVGPSARNS